MLHNVVCTSLNSRQQKIEFGRTDLNGQSFAASLQGGLVRDVIRFVRV